MKPIHAYYAKVLELINTGVKGVATGTYPARAIEVDLISLSGKANVAKTPSSWEGAQDANILSRLLRCVNDSRNVDDETWKETREAFVIAAFKDLSALRDPRAMQTFEKIREVCVVNDGELLLWGRKVTEREDGSAVVVLHVSDLQAFEKMLHKQHGHGLLQEGLMIYQ